MVILSVSLSEVFKSNDALIIKAVAPIIAGPTTFADFTGLSFAKISFTIIRMIKIYIIKQKIKYKI